MTLSRFKAPIVAGFLVSLIGEAAQAQIITGQIEGIVRDATGAVLPGAVVTATSPALLAGSASTTANEKGRYRLPALPPGTYALEISTASFRSYREEGLRVLLGGTVERAVTLELAGVAEELAVTPAGSLVDPKKIGVTTHYGTEYIENLPRNRLGLSDFVQIAPGISAHDPTFVPVINPAGIRAVSAAGSGVSENALVVDGLELSPPLDADALEEIEILTVGASVEYGNFQGAVFNVVTKAGGNDWSFDASYFHQNPSLVSSPIEEDCNCPAGETGVFIRGHDLSGHVGGPVVKDKVWFFGGVQSQWGRRTFVPGQNPDMWPENRNDRYTAKLTWQATPRLRVMHAFHGGGWEFCFTCFGGTAPESIAITRASSPSLTFASLNWIASDSTLLDLRVAGGFGTLEAKPNPGASTEPGRFDFATGLVTGAPAFNRGEGHSFPITAKVTHYAENFLGADHGFKFGVQYKNDSGWNAYGYPGNVRYYDYAGEPYYAYFVEPQSYGAGVRQLGIFGEDVVRLGESWTLSLGLRLDRNRAISIDVPEFDDRGRRTGGTVEGNGTAFAWSVVSPRLGVTFQLGSDGRTVLRGSWGRYHQGALGVDLFHPGFKPRTAAFFDPATGQYSDIAFVFDPLRDQRLDPDLRPPSTDHLSIGLDRQLGRDTVLGMSYIRKDGRNFTGFVDIGGVYGTDTLRLDDGRSLTVFPLLNSNSDKLFLLTNPDGWFLRYDGLLVTLDKRWSRGWQALLSYSFSAARGLQTPLTRQAGAPQQSVGTSGPRSDPNSLINAEGRLGDDRPHMLRLQAVGEVPRIGVRLGVSYQYLTGKPWAATARARLPQGGVLVLVEPPGARRFPSQSLLDLRISKAFRLGETGELELIVDVLNALGGTPTKRVRSTLLGNPNFGVGRFPIPPRRALLGVRVRF